MDPIRFVSANPRKRAEVQAVLADAGIAVAPVDRKIEELQTQDPHRLIKAKAIRAFEEIGRPLFVEHSGLYLHALNGLPGGLTQIFWDTLQMERFVAVFGDTADPRARARSLVGYVDGRRFHWFAAELAGRIAPTPQGDPVRQWSCIFVPEGYTQTLAELEVAQPQVSMRWRSLDALARFLTHTAQPGDADRAP
jgi:XTP/dITP diphosphohydrolase